MSYPEISGNVTIIVTMSRWSANRNLRLNPGRRAGSVNYLMQRIRISRRFRAKMAVHTDRNIVEDRICN